MEIHSILNFPILGCNGVPYIHSIMRYASDFNLNNNAPDCPIMHPGVLIVVCFVIVLFWCGVLGLFFYSSFTTNLDSVLYTCIFMYIHLRLKSDAHLITLCMYIILFQLIWPWTGSITSSTGLMLIFAELRK